MADSKIKMFVNNPELWGSFTEELEERLYFAHKQLEQMADQTSIYRIQGEIKAIRSMMQLREKVNGRS